MARLLFASDIHGSPDALRDLGKWVEKLQPEQLVFLGDYLYHGPRNMLRGDYAPQEAAEILNSWKERLVAVRGNCDSEVDQLLLKFPMMGDYAVLLVDGRKFFLTHGHRWNGENPPPLGTADVVCHGHTHVPCAANAECGIPCWNPGSVSLPKGGYPPSFGWYEAGTFSVRDLLTGEVLLRQTLES